MFRLIELWFFTVLGGSNIACPRFGASQKTPYTMKVYINSAAIYLLYQLLRTRYGPWKFAKFCREFFVMRQNIGQSNAYCAGG